MDLPEWCPREIIFPGNEADKQAVRLVQRVLRCQDTGEMNPETEASIRGFQRLHKIPATGMLNKETAWAIDRYRWS